MTHVRRISDVPDSEQPELEEAQNFPLQRDGDRSPSFLPQKQVL